jgi:hypothetical protein
LLSRVFSSNLPLLMYILHEKQCKDANCFLN